MITEVVVLVAVVAVVALWGLRSILRTVRTGSCAGSKKDKQARCGHCPSAAQSHCPEDAPRQGGD